MAIPTVTIRISGSNAQVFAVLRSLPATLAGHGPSSPATQRLLTRLGLTAQGLIHDAFIHRSTGSIAAGYRWKPLAPSTVRRKRWRTPDRATTILREFDGLERSLIPALRPQDATAIPPTKPLQVFRRLPGQVIIGTSRPHAAEHHKGVPGKLPRRPLWPAPKDWPKTWWRKLLQEAQHGTIKAIIELLKGRS